MQTKLHGIDTREQQIQHSPGQVQRSGLLSLLDVSSSHTNHTGISHFELLQNNSSDIELVSSDIFSKYNLQNLVGVKNESSL